LLNHSRLGFGCRPKLAEFLDSTPRRVLTAAAADDGAKLLSAPVKDGVTGIARCEALEL
jgi:hypothetical protein